MPEDETIAKLTSTTETTAWIPRDVYAGLVIEAAQANRKLAGLVGAVEHSQDKGTGNSVLVKFFPKRTAQGPIAEGASLSYASSTPTTKRITLAKYGDADLLTTEGIEQTSDDVKARILNRMGEGLARKFDEVAYGVLKTAANATTVEALAVAGTLGTDFAQKLSDAITAMEKLDRTPSHILMGPDQIASLGNIKVPDAIVGQAIGRDNAGNAVSFRGVAIVNLKSIANANAATAGMTQAVVIDSSAAFGEVYGRSPSFEERRIPLSDQWEEVVWTEYGCAALEADSIAVVKNP